MLGSETIRWNFSKFMVDRDGKVSKRYAPNTAPADLHGTSRRRSPPDHLAARGR